MNQQSISNPVNLLQLASSSAKKASISLQSLSANLMNVSTTLAEIHQKVAPTLAKLAFVEGDNLALEQLENKYGPLLSATEKMELIQDNRAIFEAREKAKE